MPREKATEISRRRFFGLAGAGLLGARAASFGPFFLFPRRAQRQQKKLKVLQWSHPVSGYDEWFDGVFAKDWAQKNNTQVIVDHLPAHELPARAREEVKAQAGHDLTMFVFPPATFEKHVIDLRDVYLQVQARHGQIMPLAQKSAFNPRTKKFFAFADCYMPAASHWLIKPWVQLGYPGGPVDYDSLRRGAREIRKRFGLPCGIGLGRTLEANVATQALLWSFGARVQDQEGNVTLNSRETVEALKFAKALFQESETPETLAWGPEENVRAILAGRSSFTVNAISLTRGAERKDPQAVKRIAITTAMRGPYDWLACPHVTSCYVVWEFAENKEDAKKFLADLMDNYKAAFKASRLCNLPTYPSIAPDLLLQLRKDPVADPPYKYMALEDTLHWTQNLGYPGFATAPVVEVFESSLLSRMFASVAKGELIPEAAASAADQEAKRIFAKWK